MTPTLRQAQDGALNPLSSPKGAPRGKGESVAQEWVTGRLSGPALFPKALLAVSNAVEANLPMIGAGGVESKENADAMLSVGALAVQVDESLWRGDISVWVPAE